MDERIRVTQQMNERRITRLEEQVKNAQIDVLNNELTHLKNDVQKLVENDKEKTKLLNDMLLLLSGN